jgi:hypothetical protein
VNRRHDRHARNIDTRITANVAECNVGRARLALHGRDNVRTLSLVIVVIVVGIFRFQLILVTATLRGRFFARCDRKPERELPQEDFDGRASLTAVAKPLAQIPEVAPTENQLLRDPSAQP